MGFEDNRVAEPGASLDDSVPSAADPREWDLEAGGRSDLDQGTLVEAAQDDLVRRKSDGHIAAQLVPVLGQGKK